MTDDRRKLIDDVRSAIAGKTTEHDILRAAVQLIDGFSDAYNWTGFYMLRGDVLEVGPYVGPVTEHVRIELNRGICGAAASQRRSLIIDDTKSDSRFLACSATTRSEIVVPLMDSDRVIGEIDIDSDRPAYFTEADLTMLEEVAAVVVARLRAAGVVAG